MATQVTPTGIQNNSSSVENITLATDGGVDIDSGHLVVTHGGNVRVNSPLQVNSTLDITGAATLGGTLDVTGNTTLSGTLNVSGAIDADGNLLTVGSLTVNGLAYIDGNVGVGVATPNVALTLNRNAGTSCLVGFQQANVEQAYIGTSDAINAVIVGAQVNDLNIRSQNNNINFSVDGGTSVAGRFNSSGKLLIGTNTARAIATQSQLIQNEGTDFETVGFSTCRNSDDAYGPYIFFGKSRSTDVGGSDIVEEDDDLGGLIWAGADGRDLNTQTAMIVGEVDGNVGVGVVPGRLVFKTTPDRASSPLERMRIRSDGRILANPGGDGIYHGSVFSRLTANVNRGFVIVNTGVGGIGPLPCDASGNTVDNSEIFGFSTARWSVMYAATGTINTSDANEKQDIRNISSSELAAAQELKTMIKAFRWKDAVEEKGEDARIHFGVIAQEVQEMFGRHGLDATNYGFWCSDTFYELDGKPVYVDEDGNYPDGAVAKTRLGIRYSELLAFVIAAL